MTAEEIEIQLLLEALYLRYHYDFRGYAMASLKRRLHVAMGRLHCSTLSALQAITLHDQAAFTELLQQLTVQVSDLFRDPGFFRAFRENVVPILSTYPSLKLWVAGCSSGEEVISFAILLHEEGLLDRTIIYATDINPAALARAESGVFAIDRLAAFSSNYQKSGGKVSLAEYYRTGTGLTGAIFDRALRKNVVFSDHSLATDSVFAEVHVVSCRNVLIYFNRALQDRALGLMRDSIVRRGFLGLGAKETLRFSSCATDFETFSAENQWHRRR